MSIKIKAHENMKAALYIRVASEDDIAVKWQEKMLRGFAEEQGFSDAEAYVDNGVSGIGLDRPAMNRLQDDIEAGLVSTVIVKDISRISRSFIEVTDWRKRIKLKGVELLSAQDDLFNDTSDAIDKITSLYFRCLERHCERVH